MITFSPEKAKQLFELAVNLVQDDKIHYVNGEYHLSTDLQIQTFPQSLTFADVSLQQQKNICQSRLDVDISSEIIRGVHRDIPLIASNMSTVIDAKFYIQLYKAGAFAVMHRAAEDTYILEQVQEIAKECEWVAASIGVSNHDLELAEQLVSAGANILFIDIAHGYSDYIIDFGRQIKTKFPHVKLVLGNTINEGMLKETFDFIDGLKVGIAQGFACETKNTAGCTEGQVSALLRFKELSRQYGVPLISDGGTREPADLTKAIAAGASSVMAGKIFAACKESAAPLNMDFSKKIYAGMASEYVQKEWKNGLKKGTCSEGGVRFLDISGSFNDVLERYSGALRSGITYSGAKDIESFWTQVKFLRH